MLKIFHTPRKFRTPLSEEGFETVTKSVTDIPRDPEWLKLEPLPTGRFDDTDDLCQTYALADSRSHTGLTPMDVYTDGSHLSGSQDMGFGVV